MQNTQNLRLWLDDLTIDLVYVAGTGDSPFMMGGETGYSDSLPIHPVHLDAFYIGQFPVTQALWQKVMGANPSYFQGDTNRPVEQVSWNDIVEKEGFMDKLNKEMANELTKAGLSEFRFCLPSEAQWEYAARAAGTEKYAYIGSDNLHEVAWYDNNSHRETKPVGLKKPNGLSLYDMNGNVWEWCRDVYDSNFYQQCLAEFEQTGKPPLNPCNEKSANYCVLRGGAWYYYDTDYLSPMYRGSFVSTDRYYYFGFRVCLAQFK